jgi:uncharacterized surface protein with fasciclin (FAS1) repeats
VEGETLTGDDPRANIMLMEQKGGTATITNVFQWNGVIQVVDSVLQPK